MPKEIVQPVAQQVFVEARPYYLVDNPKWVRGYYHDRFIVDSKHTRLYYGKRLVPQYCFPRNDVQLDALDKSSDTFEQESIGTGRYYDIIRGDQRTEHGAWMYEDTTEAATELKEYVFFKWKAMNHWLEEGEEVRVHPRDPYHRVEVLSTPRHIKAKYKGEIIADSNRAMALFETGFPIRYYLPPADIRLDLLVSSDMQTACPYKGEASYYSINLGDEEGENLLWYYPYPNPAHAKIQNLICLYHERFDQFLVDDEEITK